MLKHLERIFTVCAILFYAGAFALLLNQQSAQSFDEKPQNAVMAAIQKQADSESGDPTQANTALLVGQIVVYSMVAVLLIIHRREAMDYLRNTKLVWAIVVLAFVSVLWSDAPGFALRRCVNLAATSAFGLYLAFRYSQRQLLQLLCWACALAIVGSLIVVALRPDVGIDSALTNNAWRGVFVQKNTFGRLMSLGVLVSLFLAFDSKTYRWAYSISAMLCASMIVAARSATSAMAVPILLALLWLFTKARQRSMLRVCVTASLVLIGITSALALLFDSSDLAALLGRDTTLSGRVDIWSAVLPKILDHPWLGYGYSTFWMGMESQASADIWSILHWHVPHSHNGFLDLVEELGVVGLVLFLAGMIVSARCGLNWARQQSSIIGLWPLTYISFMFLFNLSEGSILRQDNLFWVLYVAATVFVVNEARNVLPTPIEGQLGNPAPSHAAGYASLAYQSESVGSRWP
jgi:exopolysaccharide production protein ExoQ